MNNSLSKFIAFAFTVLIAVMFDTAAGQAGGAKGPLIELPTNAQQCIRPTDVMRRDHMELLKHKRDQTMRQGIRTKDASLQGCVDCHSKKDDKGVAIPVNAEGQFCSTCHQYTAVKLDCFECHRTTPDVPNSTAAIPNTPEHKSLLASNSTEVDLLRNYLEEAK